MKRINLFFYYQWIYRRKKNYRQKIHRRSISVGDSVGKLITDGICVLHRRKNSIGKTVKSCSEVANDNTNPYRNMIMNAMRINQGNVSQCSIVEKEPNADSTGFFDLLKDSDESLWDGCMNHSKLSTVAHVFTIKSDHRLSEAGYDKIIKWARSILPEGNRLKENFYVAKSMMKPFGLGYQKIDMCPNFCMLYYLENTELTECMTCGHYSCYKPRIGRGKTLVAYKKIKYFPITPKLQRLFMSPRTAEHMT